MAADMGGSKGGYVRSGHFRWSEAFFSSLTVGTELQIPLK